MSEGPAPAPELPDMNAIGAATTGSAQALGLADRGTIEVGKVADLLVAGGDPLEEPGLLCDVNRISLVVRAGVAVAGPATLGEPTVSLART